MALCLRVQFFLANPVYLHLVSYADVVVSKSYFCFAENISDIRELG